MSGVRWEKIIDLVAGHTRKNPKASGLKPWVGVLPGPRVSPKITLGDALEKARFMPLKHTSSAAFRPDGVAERFTTSPGSSPESGAGYMHENHDVCARWLQDSNSNSAELTERESRQQSMLRDGRPGPDSAARCNYVLGPRSHFRPIPGLVSLFARTGTSRTGPRATLFRKPHIPSRKPISYADVLRAADMDGGRSSQGGAGGRGAGPGGSRTGLGAGPGRAGADLGDGWVTQGGARSRGAGLGGRGFRHGQGAVPGRAGFQQAHKQGFDARRGSFYQFGRGMNHFSNSRVVRGSSAFRGRGLVCSIDLEVKNQGVGSVQVLR